MTLGWINTGCKRHAPDYENFTHSLHDILSNSKLCCVRGYTVGTCRRL